MNMLDPYQVRFYELCRQFEMKLDQINQAFSELSNRYDEKHRHYHTLTHVYKSLEIFDKHKEKIKRNWNVGESDQYLNRIEMALWFHDAVYTIGSKYNEECSADLIKKLNIVYYADECRIASLIMATKHSEPFKYFGDESAEFISDVDMAILGSERHEYNAYAEAIKRENCPSNWNLGVEPNQIALENYAIGRTKFLRSLEKPIFKMGFMREQFEEKAWANIKNELELLETQLPAFEVVKIQQISSVSYSHIRATSEEEAIELSKVALGGRTPRSIPIGLPAFSAERLSNA